MDKRTGGGWGGALRRPTSEEGVDTVRTAAGPHARLWIGRPEGVPLVRPPPLSGPAHPLRPPLPPHQSEIGPSLPREDRAEGSRAYPPRRETRRVEGGTRWRLTGPTPNPASRNRDGGPSVVPANSSLQNRPQTKNGPLGAAAAAAAAKDRLASARPRGEGVARRLSPSTTARRRGPRARAGPVGAKGSLIETGRAERRAGERPTPVGGVHARSRPTPSRGAGPSAGLAAVSSGASEPGSADRSERARRPDRT